MLKILIWFCVVVLVSCKPSPDGKTREHYNNYQYIKSLMNDVSNSEQSDEAPLAIATPNKKDGCDCKDQALDKGVQKAEDKQANMKRDGCCCDNCCCDCCDGGHCGGCCCNDCCHDCCHGGCCCHGGDCCHHDCCHDCCHGDCCHCGCGCCTNDCHCHDQFHQNWVPACCCCCCNQNTAADKAKSAKAAAAPPDNSTVGNATDIGNATVADSAKEKPAESTVTDTAPAAAAPTESADKAPANETKEAIKDDDASKVSGDSEASWTETSNRIKAAINRINAQTVLRRSDSKENVTDKAGSVKSDVKDDKHAKGNDSAEDASKSISAAIEAINDQSSDIAMKKPCTTCGGPKRSSVCADKDSKVKATNKPEAKSHCCCGCDHHHHHHGCGCHHHGCGCHHHGCGCHHHGCHHHCGCHHHHHHHHHHCCCSNNKNGNDNNSCCGNKDNNSCCGNTAGSDSACGCAGNDDEKEDDKE